MADRVRVRHASGVVKDVLSSQLSSLSGRWSVVDPQPEPQRPEPKKRSAKKAESIPPAVEPDTDSLEG